jgi:hypothetical protein
MNRRTFLKIIAATNLSAILPLKVFAYEAEKIPEFLYFSINLTPFGNVIPNFKFNTITSVFPATIVDLKITEFHRYGSSYHEFLYQADIKILNSAKFYENKYNLTYNEKLEEFFITV